MTKDELVGAVAIAASITRSQAQEAINSVLLNMAETLRTGGTFKLVNFGTFKRRDRPARKGRNPQTGEPLIIPASRSVRFKAAPSLIRSL